MRKINVYLYLCLTQNEKNVLDIDKDIIMGGEVREKITGKIAGGGGDKITENMIMLYMYSISFVK